MNVEPTPNINTIINNIKLLDLLGLLKLIFLTNLITDSKSSSILLTLI